MTAECADHFVCDPLDNIQDIIAYSKNLPAWRTLCEKLEPERHSSSCIKNMNMCKDPESLNLERPMAFCHVEEEEQVVQRWDRKGLPKTLVCHDMANGYHDDAFIHGTKVHDAYTFYNWSAVDIFCYFSHHLITIPPVSWINVAHAHGCKVIGTVVTEWSEGTVIWDQMLSSTEYLKSVAEALVNIAVGLRFDGYLLNIENKVTNPERLMDFVKFFHSELHKALPDAELIWYDSVTIEGKLSWQNRLNDRNKAFFAACDGFFVNYSWLEEDLTASAQAAGERLTDLYVGVDVWGRNFHGGGQFNTQAAVQLIHKLGCSMAIFGPAWTHEGMISRYEQLQPGQKEDHRAVLHGERLSRLQTFMLRDRALWDSLWPYLNTRVPAFLPFRTSFCKGRGLKRFLYGEVISPGVWYNLRHQQYQSNCSHGPHGYLVTTQRRLELAMAPAARARGILKLRHSLYNLEDPAPGTYKKPETETEEDEEDDDTNEDKSRSWMREPPPETKSHSIRRRLSNFGHIIKKMLHIKDQERGESSERPSESRTSASMVKMSVNIALRRNQDCVARLAYVAEEKQCFEECLVDAFVGGASLMVHPSDDTGGQQRTSRLLHCDFLCKEELVCCVVTKTLAQHEHQSLNVILHGVGREGGAFRVCLLGRADSADGADGADQCVSPLADDSDRMNRLRAYLRCHLPEFYVPTENHFGWSIRYYIISVSGWRAQTVYVRTQAPHGPILLGMLGFCAAKESDVTTSNTFF